MASPRETVSAGCTGRRGARSFATRRSPSGHPARGRSCARQVSWLTGRHGHPSSQGIGASVTSSDERSPLTVAGAAPDNAAIMAAPGSHLSPRHFRIEGTSNTRYSRRGKKCVNSYDGLSNNSSSGGAREMVSEIGNRRARYG